MRRVGTLIALLLATFVVAAGSCDRKGLGDAPVGERHEAPREVWVMPDKFANLAGVCIDGDLILVTTREAPPVVLKDSRHCVGKPR